MAPDRCQESYSLKPLLYLQSMKKPWFKRLRFRELKRGWSREKTKVRFTFLGLSLILWFLIKLSKGGYVDVVAFSIDYNELPTGLVFTEEPPEALEIKLKGTGFDIVKYAWFNYSDLDIDLNRLESDRKGRTFWTSADAANYLEAQLSDETTRILDVEPDTVFFHISRLLKRKLPIKLNLALKFDTTTHILYGNPQLTKDSVMVEAPAEVLRDLVHIETELVEVMEITDSLQLPLKLIKPSFPHLKISKEAIDLKLQFSPLTEGLLQIPIQAINVPDSVQMELFPSVVDLTFRCAIRDFKDVRPEAFLMYADFQQIIKDPERRFLYLSLDNPPSQVRSVQFLPKRVEYLLKKP